MRILRPLIAVVATCLFLLTACGGDDEPAGDDAGSSSEGDTGGEESGGEQVDVCGELTEEEVGAALGGTVTVMQVPGGGCSFNQEDPRAPSVVLNLSELVDGAGGFEGSKAGIAGVVEGEVEDVSGVGDGAFVVVGPVLGGSVTQGAGAVLLGATVVQVTLLQGQDLAEDEVKEVTVAVIELIGSKV